MTMDTPQPTPSFDDSVAQVMQTLPPVIRDYILQGKYTLVAKTLMTKYSLRIDQAGVLEQEILLLLMGVENPDEFTQALLTEAKLDQAAIDGIVRDVNTQIFAPLRAEEMKSAPTALKSETLSPPPQSPAYTNEMPQLIRSTQPQKQIFYPPLPRPAATAAAPAPEVMKMLEDHEEPHIAFAKTPAPSTPTPVRTIPIPVPASVATTPSAPSPLSGAVAAALGGNRPIMPPPAPTAGLPLKAPLSPSAPVAKPIPKPVVPPGPYASDPYREPIE